VVFLRHMAARKQSRPPARAALVRTVVDALEDMKAVNVKVLDVRSVTDVSDCMVLASGNSDRHVRSIADRVVERAKQAGFRPLGVEGQRDGEWVLVDLNDVLVHVMLPRVREFYALEELWEAPAAKVPVARTRAKSAGKSKAAGKAQAKAAKSAKPARSAKSAPKKAGARRSAAASASTRAKKTPARRAARPRG
jgi:ribosome-associated protein